jgi:phage head maturation protease
VFNSWSEILNNSFRERILPTAITMETVDASDIFATLNHDRTRPLARRRLGKGTLDISIDNKGLKYRFELSNTEV